MNAIVIYFRERERAFSRGENHGTKVLCGIWFSVRTANTNGIFAAHTYIYIYIYYTHTRARAGAGPGATRDPVGSTGSQRLCLSLEVVFPRLVAAGPGGEVVSRFARRRTPREGGARRIGLGQMSNPVGNQLEREPQLSACIYIYISLHGHAPLLHIHMCDCARGFPPLFVNACTSRRARRSRLSSFVPLLPLSLLSERAILNLISSNKTIAIFQV